MLGMRKQQVEIPTTEIDSGSVKAEESQETTQTKSEKHLTREEKKYLKTNRSIYSLVILVAFSFVNQGEVDVVKENTPGFRLLFDHVRDEDRENFLNTVRHYFKLCLYYLGTFFDYPGDIWESLVFANFQYVFGYSKEEVATLIRQYLSSCPPGTFTYRLKSQVFPAELIEQDYIDGIKGYLYSENFEEIDEIITKAQLSIEVVEQLIVDTVVGKLNEYVVCIDSKEEKIRINAPRYIQAIKKIMAWHPVDLKEVFLSLIVCDLDVYLLIKELSVFDQFDRSQQKYVARIYCLNSFKLGSTNKSSDVQKVIEEFGFTWEDLADELRREKQLLNFSMVWYFDHLDK